MFHPRRSPMVLNGRHRPTSYLMGRRPSIHQKQYLRAREIVLIAHSPHQSPLFSSAGPRHPQVSGLPRAGHRELRRNSLKKARVESAVSSFEDTAHRDVPTPYAAEMTRPDLDEAQRPRIISEAGRRKSRYHDSNLIVLL